VSRRPSAALPSLPTATGNTTKPPRLRRRRSLQSRSPFGLTPGACEDFNAAPSLHDRVPSRLVATSKVRGRWCPPRSLPAAAYHLREPGTTRRPTTTTPTKKSRGSASHYLRHFRGGIPPTRGGRFAVCPRSASAASDLSEPPDPRRRQRRSRGVL